MSSGSSEHNFAAWLLEAGQPDAIALVEDGRSITFAELGRRVRHVAAFVKRQTSALDRRAVVPVCGENSIDLIGVYLGILYAGAIAAPLAELTAESYRSVLEATRAPFVFTDRARHSKLVGVAAQIIPFDVVLDEAMDSPEPVDPDALVLLLHTSGSTGRPQGVMLSSNNLRANTRSILTMLPLEADDRVLATLPFYYCYGLSVLHTHLRAGASAAIVPMAFPEPFLDAVERHQVTGMPGVPAFFQTLLGRSSIATRNLPRLRYVMSSGGHLPDAAVQRLQAALPAAKIVLRYGVTECTAAVSYLPAERLADKRGSIGKGLPDAAIAVERTDGTAIEPGSEDVGEIVVRGDHVALGYFHEPAASSFRGGAFFTGDMARVDADGFVFIVGRAKEFVKTGGHRVSPQEIEDVIARIPGVVEVGVCGLPHPQRGEALHAAVVTDVARPVTIETVIEHCRSQLPAFKVPVEVRIVDELEKTGNGKLARQALAARMKVRT